MKGHPLVLGAFVLAACSACPGTGKGPPAAPAPAPGEGPLATLVAGRFSLVNAGAGTSPDGDTVRFVPDRPGACAPRPCPRGLNVRLASIDALELHYDCGHQDLALARAARDRLLALLGFRSVTYRPDRPDQVASSEPASVRGHLLAFGADTTGDRVAAYAFAGDARWPDGATVPVDAEAVRRSVNHALLREGYAFPAYFADSLAAPGALDAAVRDARAAGAGVWSAAGAPGADGADVVARAWPALARSVCRWRRQGQPEGSYEAWLRSRPGTPYRLRPGGRTVHLRDVVVLDGARPRLSVAPEALVAR